MQVVLGLGVLYIAMGIGLWTPISLSTKTSRPIASAAFHDAFIVCAVVGFVAMVLAGIVMVAT